MNYTVQPKYQHPVYGYVRLLIIFAAKPFKSVANRAILLIHCPDRPGLVALVTEFVHKNQGNILNLDQHVDAELDHFFMRIEWELAEFVIPNESISEYFGTLIGKPNDMHWQLHFTARKPRVALFVSKASHCLYDLLQRYAIGELNCDIPLIISNHDSLRGIADRFEIPFERVAITRDTKSEQEAKTKELLTRHDVDFIVLARYMQILSDDFCRAYAHRIINIHHSFLPAFKGARPYHNAYNRGVKLIGATSHYVTADLDEGPIIAQDVAAVSHRDGINDLKRIGRDVEKRVLSKAVYLQLQYRVLPFGNRTIIFD